MRTRIDTKRMTSTAIMRWDRVRLASDPRRV
jgi:hypothetical protein